MDDLLRPKWLWLFPIVLMVGCGTTSKFRAKKDESYDGKLERVLVVYNEETTATGLGRGFSARLTKRLADLLGQLNIPGESVRVDNSAVDPNAPVKVVVARFQPRQILSFTIARINSSSSTHWVNPDGLPYFSHSMVVTLEFAVHDFKTDKTVWRAAVDFYSPPSPEQVAEQLAAELRTAKLL